MVIILLLIAFQSVDLEVLQKALDEHGNPWIAGTTAVSGLSLEEKRKLCGTMTPYLFEVDKIAIQNISAPCDSQLLIPPSCWDWRNHNGHNWMTPVKDQRACGNCYLFATVGGFEARIKIVNNIPDTNIDLSEEFFTSCCTRTFGCHGGRLSASAQFVVEKGVPDEACFPYPDPGKELPCINACPDWELRAKKAKRWGATSCVPQYKSLIMKGPLACYICPKEDFFYYRGGVYTPIMGEKFNHCVTLCGWSDSVGGWVYKNSWSPAWGDSGYGWINYGEEQLVGPAYPVWLEVEPYKKDYIVEEDVGTVRELLCLQVFPNPCHSNVCFSFRVSDAGKVSIDVYDIAGKFVSCIVDKLFQPGDYEINWDGTDQFGKKVAPSVYFIKLRSELLERGNQVKKLILF